MNETLQWRYSREYLLSKTAVAVGGAMVNNKKWLPRLKQLRMETQTETETETETESKRSLAALRRYMWQRTFLLGRCEKTRLRGSTT